MSFLAKIYKQRLRMTDALYGPVGGDRVSPDIRGVVAESDWQVRGHLPLCLTSAPMGQISGIA